MNKFSLQLFKMKKLLVCLSIFMISVQWSFAQKKEKMSPSELMFEYYDEEFRPFNKDKWFVALSFSLEDQNLQSGNKYIGFDRIIEGSEFNYEIKAKGGYSIGKSNFVGLGITHGREEAKGTGVIILDTINSKSITNSNTFSPFLRTYYPLSKNRRLSFFNEIKMDFGFSNTDISKFENSEQTELETEESFLFGIGISPGITFFAIESFAFEIQLDVLGYEYEKFKSIDEEGNEFSSDSHNVNFQIDLLSINFGLAYYFGAKK